MRPCGGCGSATESPTRRASRALTTTRPEATSTAVEVTILLQKLVHCQLRGWLAEADATAARLLELSTAPGDDSGRNYEALNGFVTARERGILAEIRPIIEALDSPEAAGPTAAIRASGLAESAPDLALAELERARPFDDVADDPGYQVTVCEYVQAAALLGHAEASRELYPLVEALDTRGQEMMVTGGYAPGSIGAYLARLSATMGHHKRADAQFRRGIAVCDSFGATAHQARERVDYAAFCLRLGRTEDARRLAQEALDLVTDTELVDSRNRATALLAQLDG